MNSTKREDSKQAVIVDYKAIGCRAPGGNSNTKPFIQFSLEWLLIEKFDEVFICCLPDNVQQMREFVKSFLGSENSPNGMSVQVHSSENNLSTGDCLRDLDAKGLIKSDFVIMDVGCCGNLPLAELLNEHKKLKKSDKDALLTSIVRNLFTKNPAEIGEFPIYISDPSSGRLLYYVAGRVAENERPGPVIKTAPIKSIHVPTEIFLDRESVKIYTNLCSTNLSIYSADVPARYAELFDCHSEADLIQAAFDNHEVLGKTVYIHIVDDLFSQRMADFGFAINQKRDKFDTNLIYKRNDRCQVLRKLVNDSLIDCTRLNSEDYLTHLSEDEDSDNETESCSEMSALDEDEKFFTEVLDSLVRGFEETIVNENLVLEVNSSKHAYNISIDDVFATIARSILSIPANLTKGKATNSSEFFSIVEKSILKFREFLLNYMKNEESRSIVINTMESLCLSKQIDHFNDTVFAKVIYKLYEVDALDEDSIIDWYNNYDKAADDVDDGDGDDDQREILRSKPAFKQLIQALEADSEEDEDDEESE